jgi:lysophospholipase L1-like esterase/pimeloyl-ACP methyl ester carboxylesterase
MKTFIMSFLFCIAVNSHAQVTNKIKVACIGASITEGAGLENKQSQSYPAQLQTMLGDGYEVVNYGVSGCTMLRKGDKPYWNMPAYKKALAYNPNIVLIDLGGNDSKLINRIYLNEYKKDYIDMIQSFASLPSHPRIVMQSPIGSFVTDTAGIWEPVIVNRIIPLVKEVAFEEKCEWVNLYALFINKPQLLPDKIHPNLEGTTMMAKHIYEVLVTPRDPGFDLFPRINIPDTISSFHGYECADFTFKGRACKIVRPKIAAKDHPWFWRARFWGHEPQTDIALLERGYHVVYCDVVELLGNKEAIAAWNDYYSLLHHAGLSKKAALVGMSRGAVYVYNWAAANPKKVACVYVDNPLLNITDWAVKAMQAPNKGGNQLLEDFKKDYNLLTDEQVKDFKGGPIDEVNKIVKGNYPSLILCADEDEAVSPSTNTNLFEKLIKERNGKITVIHKPGFKHHPHSLPDPTPIVDFIMSAVNGPK